jgi:minor histocompatibility antigen H13
VPGIFIALVLRMDVARAAAAPAGQPPAARYFTSAMVGYVGGLATTIAVMNLFNAAQPALLYIVPAVLGSVATRALVAGEARAVFAWSEEAEAEAEEAEEAEGAAAGAAKGEGEGDAQADGGWVKLPKAEAKKGK